MIVDKFLRVSDAQTVTATAVSTSSVDLGTARELGEGRKVRAYFTVDETVTAAGAATVTFQIVTADDAALTSNVTVIGSSRAIGKAALPLDGTPLVVEMNPEIGGLGRRYLGVQYTIATGPLTAGKFTADMVLDIADGKKFYASGIAVS